MKRSEAMGHVQAMLTAAQKSRSTFVDPWSTPGAAEEMGKLLSPWLFGERNVLDVLVGVLDGQFELNGTTFMNLLFIARRLEPSIDLCCAGAGHILPDLTYYDLEED